jgi:hypothetical protein
MQTSRFQLGLIATLAVGLGFSLSSSVAVGYPAGAAVSMGTNPLFAKAGDLDGNDTQILLTAPSDQRVVVTDLTVSAWDESVSCKGSGKIDLLVDGVPVASLIAGLYGPSQSYSSYSPVARLELQSGLPVGPDQTLTIQTAQMTESSCFSSDIDFRYTVSGYHAQP